MPLHQLIEVKEGCEATGRKLPVARMTYQRFFRRYQRLSGMSGTVKEVAREMWSVYRLPVVVVPPNRPLRRTRCRDQIHLTAESKWRTIAERIEALHRQGRPVLLGTRSVATSERASQHLSQAGIAHRVLNAAQDKDEAEIIAVAGEAGRVTIATNMAGRGTDIKLGTGVADKGGLHVILSERHDARRIDRQLEGGCGRQGDPGSVGVILSFEDPLLEVVHNDLAGKLVALLSRLIGGRLRMTVFNLAQSKAERIHSRMRRDLLKSDRKLGDMLAFSGKME